MNNKKRLDAAVFEQGFCESREKAKTLIMAGVVYVNNQKADKPGMTVKDDDTIEVRSNPLKYVSRGGLKLEKAMQSFDLQLDGSVCADIGAFWDLGFFCFAELLNRQINRTFVKYFFNLG